MSTSKTWRRRESKLLPPLGSKTAESRITAFCASLKRKTGKTAAFRPNRCNPCNPAILSALSCLLPVEEAARELGVSAKRVARLVSGANLHGLVVGGKIWIPAIELAAFQLRVG